MVYFSTRKKNKKNYIIHYCGLGRGSGNALPSRWFPLDPTLGTCPALQSKRATRQCKMYFYYDIVEQVFCSDRSETHYGFLLFVRTIENVTKAYTPIVSPEVQGEHRSVRITRVSFFFFIIFAENPVQTEVFSPLKNLPEQSAMHFQLYQSNLTHTAPKLHHSTS